MTDSEESESRSSLCFPKWWTVITCYLHTHFLLTSPDSSAKQALREKRRPVSKLWSNRLWWTDWTDGFRRIKSDCLCHSTEMTLPFLSSLPPCTFLLHWGSFVLTPALCRLLHLLLQTWINSNAKIPLKILSPGCHLFSRGLDQVRPKASCRDGGTSVSMRALEKTTIKAYFITVHARVSASDTSWEKYTRTKLIKSSSTLGFKVKCLHCVEKLPRFFTQPPEVNTRSDGDVSCCWKSDNRPPFTVIRSGNVHVSCLITDGY